MDRMLRIGRRMALTLLLLLTPAAVLAMGTTADTTQSEPGPYFMIVSEDGRDFYHVDQYGNPVDLSSKTQGVRRSPRKAGSLPAYYDARNDNIVTPAKKQGNTGTCWAFAAISAFETNAIKKGLTALEDTDYSEAHLAWFALNPNVEDPSDPTRGDGVNKGIDGFSLGGNYLMASATLFRNSGAVNESDYPFDPNNLSSMAFDNSERYKSVMRLKGCYRLDTYDENNYSYYSDDDVKQAILDYGSVQMSYYNEDIYNNITADYAAYFNFDPIYDNQTDHVVTIVGWDDSFSKNNFKAGTLPQNDGAWIIKNSWGINSPRLKEGYMYISYEDVSLGKFIAYEAQSADTFDNLYTYNGIGRGTFFLGGTANPVANVFTAAARQDLTQVGFFAVRPGTSYTVSVYTDIPEDFTNPTQGTLHADLASGFCAYQGYYSVDLPDAIELSANELYAVQLVFTHPTERNLISFEGSAGSSEAKQTFVKRGGNWVDCYPILSTYEVNNAIITAMTIDAHEHLWANPLVTAATCTQRGFTAYTCACGETTIADSVNALGHSYGEWTQTAAPACTTQGEKSRACSRCPDMETQPVDALGHSMGGWVYSNGTHARGCTRTGCTQTESGVCGYGAWITDTSPDCSSQGMKHRVCTVCAGVETQVVPAKGHTPGQWTITLAPACTEDGTKEQRCMECTELLHTDTVPAKGHTPGAHVVVTAATCAASGLSRVSCTVCTAALSTAEIPLNPSAHDLGGWRTTTPPTCTQAGVRTRVCSRCPVAETEAIAKTAHPDANADGYCDACSAELHTHEPPASEKSFLDRIIEFFQKIADFFKRLFGG